MNKPTLYEQENKKLKETDKLSLSNNNWSKVFREISLDQKCIILYCYFFNIEFTKLSKSQTFIYQSHTKDLKYSNISKGKTSTNRVTDK